MLHIYVLPNFYVLSSFQGRIKKIMQTDEEVGKVSQHCPIMISRCLELFIESLLSKTVRVTNSRNAKTLSPSHMKLVIESEKNFDFLRDLVKDVKDVKDMPEEENGQDEAAATGSNNDNEPIDYSSKPPPSSG